VVFQLLQSVKQDLRPPVVLADLRNRLERRHNDAVACKLKFGGGSGAKGGRGSAPRVLL
jgi:hypothetical protein